MRFRGNPTSCGGVCQAIRASLVFTTGLGGLLTLLFLEQDLRAVAASCQHGMTETKEVSGQRRLSIPKMKQESSKPFVTGSPAVWH